MTAFSIALPTVILGVTEHQEQAASNSEPHRRLEFLAGGWTCDARGEIGEVAGTVSCDWANGGKFLVCRGEWNRPEGTVEINNVWGYHAARGSFTWYRHWSNGFSDFWRGWIRDGVWTFVEDSSLANVKTRRLVTIEERSPSSWYYKFEYSEEGAPWKISQDADCRREE